MFPGCPDHCNAERTLSKYSRNIACRRGDIFKESTKPEGSAKKEKKALTLKNSIMLLNGRQKVLNDFKTSKRTYKYLRSCS